MERILCPDKLSVDPHSPNSEKEYKHWRKTFDNFIIECNDRAPDKLRCLTKYVSASVYENIADEATFEGAVAVLEKLYIKKRNEIFARHLLATRRQQASESLDEFLQELHRLSKNCDFKSVSAEEYRVELVRDAFINGLSSATVRQRLLENQTLTLTQAHDQARALDFAQRNSDSYKSHCRYTAATTNCNPLAEQTPFTAEQQTDVLLRDQTLALTYAKKRCWFCGGIVHPRNKCPARDSTCTSCTKIGHWAKVCQSKNKTKVAASIYSPSLCAVTAAVPRCLRYSTVPLMANGHNVSGLIDCGSSDSFIDEKIARDLKLAVTPVSQHITLASSSHTATVLGMCTVDLQLMNSHYPGTPLGIIKDLCGDIILGVDFQKQHSSVTIAYGGNKPELRISNVGDSFCSLVSADVQEPLLFANMKDNVRPVAAKSRDFGWSDRQFIAQEIDNLLSENIIEPSTSPWRAQVVVVKDEQDRHKKRLCIDYSLTVNIYTDLDAYPLPKINTMINDLARYKIFSTFDLKSAYHQIPISDADKPFTAFEANGRLYQFTRVPFGVTNGVAVFQRTIDKLVEEENLKDTFPYLDNITIAGRDENEHNTNLANFLTAAKRRNLTLNKSKSVLSTTSINILGYHIGNGVIRPDQDRLKPLLELSPHHDYRALQRVLGMFAYYAKWIPSFSDKSRPLYQANSFPLNDEALAAFHELRGLLGRAALSSIDDAVPFVVECDASDIAVSATLNQAGRPVAFMTRTLNKNELHYPPVEKEATAVIEAVRKWSHLLAGRHFTLVTDQRSVAFMLDNRKHTKVKNDKIQGWRLELASFTYSIYYRPGKENVAPDALTRAVCASTSVSSLVDIHIGLCHPGVTRMLHFIRSKNLPFSTDDVKNACSSCRVCAEIKPRFYRSPIHTLIKATRPMERLSIDFKGPLPSQTKNVYLFTAVDEYSRFPFAIPCSNMTSQTVIKCLDTIFSFCGMSSFIHSDRGSSFLSREVQDYLAARGVASSRSTPYHPTGNSQVERYNGIIWKAVCLAVKSYGLPESAWETVLEQALHSIRSLLSTSTNVSPHERFFAFSRRSCQGSSLPAWLMTPGPILLRRFVRSSKSDPLVDEVELLLANPSYAHIRHPDGRESTVSLRDLAPCPSSSERIPSPEDVSQAHASSDLAPSSPSVSTDGLAVSEAPEEPVPLVPLTTDMEDIPLMINVEDAGSRRSSRVRREPQRYGWEN